MTHPIKRIAVTGGTGQVAYQLLFRIANGELLGRDQPISLHILDIPATLPALEGIKMELQDCAFHLLHGLEVTTDPYQAFKDVDFALLVGAKPRSSGMERKELLLDNGKIFVEQGKALNEVAKEEAKVLVVGNPCNTNCLITMSHASRLPPKNFFAMTRLDQNRATFFLAQKAQLPVYEVSHMIIGGNHSSTQVPDFIHARLRGHPAEAVIQDRHWLEKDFFELVQKRGASIIRARGKSSAASAAQSVIDTMHDILYPTHTGHWFSAAVATEGNPYGIQDQLIFSFPCQTFNKGEMTIVHGLDIPEFLDLKLKATERELMEERDLVKSLIK